MVEESVQTQIHQLLETAPGLVAASLDAQGLPHASYTPFAVSPPNLYILISELAAHTRNLRYHPVISALILAPESEARNAYARPRLQLELKAQELPGDTPEAQQAMDGLQERHGETVSVLQSLPDFHLFRLEPAGGRFIRGFGDAWRLGPRLEILDQITGSDRR